jgi:hypothetical protein
VGTIPIWNLPTAGVDRSVLLTPLWPAAYDCEMDVEQSSRAPVAFRQTCRAAALTLGLFFGPPFCVIFAIAFGESPLVRGVVGICFGAYALRLLVRRINRHDDPRKVNRPSDAP